MVPARTQRNEDCIGPVLDQTAGTAHERPTSPEEKDEKSLLSWADILRPVIWASQWREPLCFVRKRAILRRACVFLVWPWPGKRCTLVFSFFFFSVAFSFFMLLFSEIWTISNFEFEQNSNFKNFKIWTKIKLEQISELNKIQILNKFRI
jgi:hypothetical protein